MALVRRVRRTLGGLAALAAAMLSPPSVGAQTGSADFCTAVRAAVDAARAGDVEALAAPSAAPRIRGGLAAPPPFNACAGDISDFEGRCAIENGPFGAAWSLTQIVTPASHAERVADELAWRTTLCFDGRGLKPSPPPWPAPRDTLTRVGFVTADDAARVIILARASRGRDGAPAGDAAVSLSVEARDETLDAARAQGLTRTKDGALITP